MKFRLDIEGRPAESGRKFERPGTAVVIYDTIDIDVPDIADLFQLLSEWRKYAASKFTVTDIP